MAPIEVLRGGTPEELAQKFNQRENEGWKPISQGVDDREESHFMFVYRPLHDVVGEQGLEMPSETVTVTEERLNLIHLRLKEIYPKGQVTNSIREKEAKFNAVERQIERDYDVKRHQANIAFLFPPDPNMPMAKLYFNLARRGFGMLESLLSFPEDEWIRGIGMKGKEAIRAIKEILLTESK